VNYKLVNYKDIRKDEWDAYIEAMPSPGYHHSWSLINYISHFPGVKENLSFIYLGEDGSVLAVCPLAISLNETGGYFEMSFGGNFCGVPLVADAKPSFRRKILDEVFSKVMLEAKQSNVKKINMVWDPLTKDFFTNSSFHKNNFELLRYQMHCYVENIAVIDLNFPEDALFENVSEYQRRHIKRAEKQGIVVKMLNDKSNASDAKKYFGLFQEAHFRSARRMTRPQETWDAMLDGMLSGEASLFVAFAQDVPISYLYCGEFGRMAFGWSQVNIDDYEMKYSPRQILEWKAMMFYKERGFKYYEIGERYFGSQFLHISTDKEVSISILKERFGGFLLPKIRWTGYFDAQLLRDETAGKTREFLAASPTVSVPEH
jgi:Acetyltransferase (GNAT) domain